MGVVVRGQAMGTEDQALPKASGRATQPHGRDDADAGQVIAPPLFHRSAPIVLQASLAERWGQNDEDESSKSKSHRGQFRTH